MPGAIPGGPLGNKSAYFRWYGAEVEAKAIAKVAVIVENITAAAAEYARNHHSWSNRTGQTEASVFHAPVQIDGLVVKGFWGAGGAALWLEYGTHKMPARPWLRPAADATYRLAHFAGALGASLGSGLNFPPSLI